jgi:pyrroloquinoline quinone biosynthesis protein B
VPHRAEISETVGFAIQGPSRSAFFLPDIDSFEAWDRPLEELLARTDRAWIDGTFFSAAELPGRDLATIPHPLMQETLQRLEATDPALRSKVHFIHLNHSNPVCDPANAAYQTLAESGCLLAERGDRLTL